MRIGFIAALVVVSSCEDRSGGTKPEEAGADPRKEETRNELRKSKSKQRHESLSDLPGRSLAKIKQALESTSPEEALTILDGLLDSRAKVSEEVLAVWREEAEGREGKSRKVPALQKRLALLDSEISEAFFAMRNHDLDQAKVDSAMQNYQEAKARLAIIRELRQIGDDPVDLKLLPPREDPIYSR
jgi:hypothetical protein